jgi:hypothetical protein
MACFHETGCAIKFGSYDTIAQSFSPNLAQDGRQVCRPAQISRVTGLCYFGHTEICSWATSLSPILCQISRRQKEKLLIRLYVQTKFGRLFHTTEKLFSFVN